MISDSTMGTFCKNPGTSCWMFYGQFKQNASELKLIVFSHNLFLLPYSLIQSMASSSSNYSSKASKISFLPHRVVISTWEISWKPSPSIFLFPSHCPKSLLPLILFTATASSSLGQTSSHFYAFSSSPSRLFSKVKIVFSSLFKFQISVGSLLPKAGMSTSFSGQGTDGHVYQWVMVLQNSLDFCHCPTLFSPNEETQQNMKSGDIFTWITSNLSLRVNLITWEDVSSLLFIINNCQYMSQAICMVAWN